MPPAADTMCCSAMPHSMKRSGSSALNASMPQSDSRSASSTTMSGRVPRHLRAARRRRRAPAAPGFAGATRTGSGADVERQRRLAERREPRVDARDQLADRGEVVLQRRRAGVEVIRLVAAREPFHERHALALDRVGDEHLRPVGDGREVRERVADRARSRGRRRAALPSRTRGTCPRSARDR